MVESHGDSAATGLPVWPERSADFEHQRVLAAARRALFARAPSITIGRYHIERRVGAGGMGEVYLGVDPELQRRVAIKLVLPHLDAARGPERLRREARALARLSHPNVVQVYEVGEHQGRTFLAMELVEGGTLTDWLAARPRRWSEILGCFIDAGRGLAAAHAAGIVHRDFKPENVPMTREGRVCVADFGLALTEDSLVAVTDDDPDSWSNHRLSTTGAVVGTMRYMPLEQIRGESVDARADQFAFCVALYEALWTRPPFPARTPRVRILALETESAAPPPPGRVPRGLWRVIRRGLARDPSVRWPDMEALVEALEAIPRRRRRAAVGAALLLASGPLLATAFAPDVPEPAEDPCADVEDVLAPHWSPAQRHRLIDRFQASGLRFAQTTASTVTEALDDWSTRWIEERRGLCWAGMEARLPDEVLGLRGACLDHQRQQLAASAAVLTRADDDAIHRAHQLVASLPEPSLCRDDSSLWSTRPSPKSSAAERVVRLRRVLARSQALRLAGRPAAAEALVEEATQEAQTLDYPPILAEALAESGELAFALDRPEHGIERMERAVDLAEASHHDHLAARVWLDLASWGAGDLHDAARGTTWLRRADAAHRRIGGPSSSGARIEFVRGRLAEQDDRLEQAESIYRRALELLDGEQGLAPSLLRAGILARLAPVVAARGGLDEALALHRRALQSAEAGLGPEHPWVADHAFALAQALVDRGPSPEVGRLLERATRLWLHGDGLPASSLGVALLAQTQLALEAGDLPQAQQHAQSARRVFERSLPPGHPHHANASMALAVVADELRDHPAALEAFERAIAQLGPSVDPKDPTLTLLQANAGKSLLELHRWAEARRRFEAALELERPDAHLPIARLGLAVLDLRDGHPATARAHLQGLVGSPPKLEPGDRLELRLLQAVTALRQGRPSVPRPELLAALQDPDHPHHRHLRDVGEQIALTPAERTALDMRPARPQPTQE